MSSNYYLIDVDGVVANFTGKLLSDIGAALRPQDITQWDLFGLLSNTERTKAFEVLKDPHWWRTMPLILGAGEAIDAICAAHPVMFLSAPWPSCKEWESARRDWLKLHFGSLSQNFISAPSDAKWIVNGATIIDDKDTTVASWSDAHPGKPAWLFSAPYNAGHPHALRLNGWPSDTQALLTLHEGVVQ